MLLHVLLAYVDECLSVRVQGVLVDVELLQRMTGVCRNSVRAFVEDRTDKDGRVSIKALNKFAQMTGLGAQEPWNDVMKVLLPSMLQLLYRSPYAAWEPSCHVYFTWKTRLGRLQCIKFMVS